MFASPFPVMNSKVTGPLTVNWRSNAPSTFECEAQPAIALAAKATVASQARLLASFIFLGFRVPNNMRCAIFPIKLYEKAQLEVPWTAVGRTKTRKVQVDFTRSFNFEKRIERTLPISFQVDRHDGEAGLFHTCNDLAGHGGF